MAVRRVTFCMCNYKVTPSVFRNAGRHAEMFRSVCASTGNDAYGYVHKLGQTLTYGPPYFTFALVKTTNKV